MADTQSNIQVNIDTTQALASIKNLQRQISAFHSSMAKGGAAANAVSAQMQQTLINSVNATGKFSAQIRTIRTTTESFTDSLEKNKFSLGEYFRHAGGASKTFGRFFKTEFSTISKVARENVKDLQTQYISLGRDASGAMKSIAVRPLALDMTDLSTRTQVAAQKQAILNQLLKQGSTNLLNFGKNTQWAGRQLMVGFTLPLIAVGSAASKTFMDMETQAIRFKKVYGDLFTPNAESAQALKDIQELGKEFTKYGIAVSSTVGLAAEAAAAGFKGVDLTRQTTAATRLSILGQVESQKALETTIALQNAFSMSSENLAESIDFLNAVENQTVLSLDDVSTAIPKAAPIIQQLGGDVKDLAFFMTAMKEGGINASEGANAIKSGLASMINPTGKASAMLESFGINVKKIVVDNKGDLKKTVVEFATALNMLDPLNRAQAIEQMFGKFQFARLSTLFANVTKEGTQASRVLDLAGSSVQDLAALSEKELGMTSESAMNKFKGAVENLKLSLIPLGEQFLKAVTPIAEFITKILDKFNGLSDRTKKIIVVITSLVAGLGPVLLMTAGLVMNGLANMIKLFAFLKSAFNKTGKSTATLGTEVKYMTTEQRNAAAVAASLDQVHTKLAQTFTSEATAVNALTRAYQRAISAQSQFVPVGPPITRGPIKKFAGGRPSTVGGTGNKDSELALLMPGETVIPTAMSKKYGPLINGMIAGNIPGYEFGKPRAVASHIEGLTPAQLVKTLSDPTMKQVLSVLPDVSVSVQALSTTADGLVTVSGAIETSLQNLATTLSENNIENATAIGTGEFAGTTIPSSSERNLMLNSAGIAGEPITFEQAQEASGKAQAYIDKPVANETDNTRAQKREAQRLVQEQVEFERSLTGLSQQEVEVRKTDFTRTKATQALEYTLMQKGLSAEEASTVAKQKIAEADKAVEQLTKKAKTDLEKRKIKEAAYQATLLKEMGVVAGYDEKKTKTTVFNRTQLNAVTRDMAKGQVQFGTPYKPGQQVPSDAAVFGSGKSFMGVKGGRVSRNQSAVVDASIRETYSADRKKIRDSFKQQGSSAAQAFRDGFKSVKTPDPYVGSRDRKSPHRLAAQDGKDDARAYAAARDKEAKRQSGRARRVATRPQGPAPIGATPQAGATILPIISRPGPSAPIDPTNPSNSSRAMSVVRGAGTRVNSMGGGMGLLGVNMGLSMAPDFAGKGILQAGLAGANMGMMFGPYGMAAGAALGVVAAGYTKLIDKQKEYAAITKSTFTVSTALITAFGDTVLDTKIKVTELSKAALNLRDSTGILNPEIQTMIDELKKLPEDDPMAIFIKKISKANQSLREVTGNIRSQVTTAIAIGGLDPENAQKYVYILMAAAGKANQFGAVWESVSKDVISSSAAITALFGKLGDAVSKTGGQWIFYKGQLGGAVEEYDNLSKEGQALADQMYSLFGAMTNGAFTFDQIQEKIGALGSSSLDAKTGILALQAAVLASKDSVLIERFALIDRIIKESGKSATATAGDYTMMHLALEMLAAQGKNLDTLRTDLFPDESQRALARRYATDQMLLDALMGGGDFEKYVNDLAVKRKKLNDALNGNDYVDTEDGVNGLSKASEAYLKVLDAEIKGLEEKRDAQKNVNDESQRHIDLQMKMKGLANEVVLAKISGDYIKAASLEQQAQNLQMEFDQDTEIRKKDAEIARLKERAQDIRDGAQLSRSEISKTPKPVKKVKEITKASGGVIRGAGTGTSDSIPAYLSNGEYVIKAKSVKKYGTQTFDALNAGRFAEGGIIRPKKDAGSMPGKFFGDTRKIKNRRYKDNMGGNTYIPNSLVVPNLRDIYETMNLANGGLIPAFGGGGIVGNILGGIGKAISKLFVGKSMGKPIKPNEVETFLSDTLGGATLPKIKKQELPAGVGGQYIPRFSDPASDYENLLPHILLNSKYKVQGNTAIHETMHHFDMDVMHDSFRRTIAKLRKDGKTDLADEYESLFVTAENKQKGMGLAAWEDHAITLEDYDSLTYFGGAAEAFADENTFKAYTKFMSSPKIKDKKLALKIGNPYGPGFSTDSLRGYFKTYSQFEHNALNMPMRLNPSFLRGLVENSPNMPQKTKDVYLAWAEGLQRFKPPARSNPDEIRNSLQFQNFKKYITDNKLDKAKGFHDGGPVGHKHPSTSYSPAPMSDAAKLAMLERAKLIRRGEMSDSLPKIPYYEQYDPRTGKAFTFPTDDEYIYDYDQLIPPSMRSKKPWYEPFKRMTNLAQYGIGNDLRGKEVTDGVVDLPYKAYKNIIFPTITWADRVAQLGPLSQAMRMLRFSGVDLGGSPYLTSTNRNQEAEWIKRSQEEGFGSVAPEMALQQGLDIAGLLPWNRIGGAIGNVGIPKATIAKMAAEKAAEKAATQAALREAGIGLPGMMQSIQSRINPIAALRQKSAEARKKFQAIKAEGKILTPEGNQARVELAQWEALLAARLNNFTPIMNLRSATPKQLIAEHNNLPSLIEEPVSINGKDFIFRFDRAILHDADTPSIEHFLSTIKTEPGLGPHGGAGNPHSVQFIDALTGDTAASIRYDPITGHVRGRTTYEGYKKQGLSTALYNKAAQITRIRHSSFLTDDGRKTALRMGGFMADDAIYDLPPLPGMASMLGIPSLKTTVQKLIKKPKKPKKPKKIKGDDLTTSDGWTSSSGSVLTDAEHAAYQARNNPPGPSMEPNTRVFADESPEATARREALMEGTRQRARQEAYDNDLPALLAAWRGNPNRTYDTYPFSPYNGTYDWLDDYELEMLMQLPNYRNAPAQVPWRPNSQRPAEVSKFSGDTSDGGVFRGATGGFMDKGKLRVPKFAEGGSVYAAALKNKFNIPLSAGSTATMFSPPTGLASDPKFKVDNKEAKSFLPMLGGIFKTLLTPFTPSKAPDSSKQSTLSKSVRKRFAQVDPYMDYMGTPGLLNQLGLLDPLKESIVNLYAGDAKWNDFTNIGSYLTGTGAIKGGVSGILGGLGKVGSVAGKFGRGIGKVGSGIKSGAMGIGKFLTSIPARIKELRLPGAYEHYNFKLGYQLGRKSGESSYGLALDPKVIAARKVHDAPLHKILDEAGYEPHPTSDGSWMQKGTDANNSNPDRYISDESHPLFHILRELNNPYPRFNPYLPETRDKFYYGSVLGAKVKSIKDGYSKFLSTAMNKFQNSKTASRLMSNRFFGIKFTDYMAEKSKRLLEPFKMGPPLSAIEEALSTTSFHGGNLTEIANRVVNSGPVKEGGKFFKGLAINPAPNWFGMDTFATSSKDVARNYLDKNGPLSSIFELALKVRSANPLDIRHGTPPLSISNPKFLRNYIKAMLKSGKTRDAFDFLIQEGGSVARRGINASEARAQEFSQGTETIEALIRSGFDSILHTGGMNVKTNPEKILHTVLGMIDPKNLITRAKSIGKAEGGYINIPKFANGGLIKGPGTGISDSIQAGFGYAGGGSIRVSNGEYVVKASSVRDYGVKTMDAINNGTATIGANSGGTVYNINMPVTSNNANPEIVANEVMRKLKLEVSKNNKTNKVGP